MKKVLIFVMIAGMMMMSLVGFTACGGSDSGDADQTTQQATEETVRAADPMTDEEQAADDSGGCIEDSEDLLN